MRQTALITGATSGLGLSYAKIYAARGFDLILTGRREEVIRKNAAELQNRYSVRVEVLIVELAEPAGVKRLLGRIAGRQIDVLVNNAGFGLKPFFAETPETDLQRMLCLHIWCTTKLARAVLPGMTARRSGVLINISSEGAFAVMPHNVLYSSTKLYLVNLTEGLHLELSGTGVQVQAVCPGFIDSHFHESAGMMREKNKKGLFAFRNPDDIAADAMRDLAKGKVVSIPDAGSRMIQNLVRFLPRKLFYRFSRFFAAKFSGKKKGA